MICPFCRGVHPLRAGDEMLLEKDCPICLETKGTCRKLPCSQHLCNDCEVHLVMATSPERRARLPGVDRRAHGRPRAAPVLEAQVRRGVADHRHVPERPELPDDAGRHGRALQREGRAVAEEHGLLRTRMK